MWSTFLTIGVILLVVLTVGLIPLVLVLIWRSGYAKGWQAAHTSPPKCTKCGYVLLGLIEPRCPECGTAVSKLMLYKAPVAYD